MDKILHQLGDLFLGSVPTIILFLLVLFFYQVLVYKPLTRMLAIRRERTLGSVEKASSAIQTADAKSQEYEAKLRAARLEIGRQRELRMQQWARERENILADARHTAQERVKDSKAAVEQEMINARQAIEAGVEQLAEQVLRIVLPSAASIQAAPGQALQEEAR